MNAFPDIRTDLDHVGRRAPGATLSQLCFSRSFTAIRKDAGLYCGPRLRSGEVFAYVGLFQNLKDLKSDSRCARCGAGAGCSTIKHQCLYLIRARSQEFLAPMLADLHRTPSMSIREYSGHPSEAELDLPVCRSLWGYNPV